MPLPKTQQDTLNSLKAQLQPYANGALTNQYGANTVVPPTPQIPNINSQTMAPAAPLSIQGSPIAPLPNIANIPTAPVTPPAAPGASDLTTQLQNLTSQLSGQALDTSSSQTQAAAPYTQQLNDINNQIRMHQANSLANQEKVMAGGGDTSFQSGEGQRVARNDAIQTMMLSSQAQALQGNITFAKDQAEAATNLKYAQVAQDIQTAKNNIYNNWDTFTAAEKKRAEATLLQLDSKDQVVARQIEDDHAISAMATAAIKNNPGNSNVQYLAQQALKTSNLDRAFSLIGQYQSNPLDIEQQIAQIAASRASTASSNVNTALNQEQLKTLRQAGSGGTSSNIVTAQGKPLTDAQASSYGYAQRTQTANDILNQFDTKFAAADTLFQGSLPNLLKSPERQQYEQASRNFVNAVLRRESGAVISPEEFKNASLQYFAQPGDAPATIIQKQQNRQQTIQNLVTAAGNPSSLNATPQPTKQIIYNGKKYNVAPDGTMTAI